MNVAVIGAGVTGIVVSDLLRDKGFDVTVFERDSCIGGIAKTKKIGEATYHVTGGHCFNSKHQDVLDYVFSKYPVSKWNKIKRDARIYFNGRFLSYPIEFSIKEIFEFDEDLAIQIILDLVNTKIKNPNNLKEWFESKFGDKLSEIYFLPYNKKIWGVDPKDMSHAWVYDKLPVPDKKSIIRSMFSNEKDTMPHAYFYYPKSNNQFDFLFEISKGLNIRLNSNIDNITKGDKGWFVNGEYYDSVISTVPMKDIFNILSDIPAGLKKSFENLSYNKVTTMLWSSEPTSQTWTYYPDKETIFHRHIHIGNFLRPACNYIITEAIGEIDKDTMLKAGKKFPHLIEPLDYHVSNHAYVVYDAHYSSSTVAIKKYLDEIGFYSIGRFGEWEYYNMDICIKSAIDLVESNFKFN